MERKSRKRIMGKEKGKTARKGYRKRSNGKRGKGVSWKSKPKKGEEKGEL